MFDCLSWITRRLIQKYCFGFKQDLDFKIVSFRILIGFGFEKHKSIRLW